MEIIDYKYFMVIIKISLANNLTKTQLGMTIVPMTYTCILDLIYSLTLWTLSNFQADVIFIITHALMSCKKFTFTHLHSLLWSIFLCQLFGKFVELSFFLSNYQQIVQKKTRFPMSIICCHLITVVTRDYSSNFGLNLCWVNQYSLFPCQLSGSVLVVKGLHE